MRRGWQGCQGYWGAQGTGWAFPPSLGAPVFVLGWNFILHPSGGQELNPLRFVPAPGGFWAAEIFQQEIFSPFFQPLSHFCLFLGGMSLNPHPLPVLFLFPPCFVPHFPLPKPAPLILPPNPSCCPVWPRLSPGFPVTQCHVRASCSRG